MLKVGSRESRLAVIQAELVIERIREICPETELRLVTMKTTGDRILHKSLDKIGGRGLFVKELDAALLEGRSDISVHSLKDMPMEVPEELPILAYTEREDARDVLVLRDGLIKLPPRPVIGTSSRRRTVQAAELYPDAEFKGLRGNVLTRLEKLDRGEYDGLILAAAGLKRLGLEKRISRYFSVKEMIPAAGQGIMAVQGRREVYEFADRLDSLESRQMAEAERTFVKLLGGGCSSPVTACARIEDGQMTVYGLYCDELTGEYTRATICGRPEDAGRLGTLLAEKLKGTKRIR